jgi:glutathione S-transferase
VFLGLRKLAFGKSDTDPDDVVERLHRQPAKHWPALEQALGERDGPWLCGEQLTYADLSGLPLAVRLPEWAPQLQPDPEQYPRVAAWLEALRARPSAAAIDQGAERVSS